MKIRSSWIICISKFSKYFLLSTFDKIWMITALPELHHGIDQVRDICLPRLCRWEKSIVAQKRTLLFGSQWLKQWMEWEKLQMTTSERRKIFCSVTFHVIAITCVVWSLYVLIDRTAEEIKQGNDNGVLEWPFWTKLVVVAIGFTGGLVFMYVQCLVYVQLWRRLKAYNRVIFVQNCPDTAKKQEKNFSCPANMDIKDAVVVPVSQTGAASLPAADAGPPEVVPV